MEKYNKNFHFKNYFFVVVVFVFVVELFFYFLILYNLQINYKKLIKTKKNKKIISMFVYVYMQSSYVYAGVQGIQSGSVCARLPSDQAQWTHLAVAYDRD